MAKYTLYKASSATSRPYNPSRTNAWLNLYLHTHGTCQLEMIRQFFGDLQTCKQISCRTTENAPLVICCAASVLCDTRITVCKFDELLSKRILTMFFATTNKTIIWFNYTNMLQHILRFKFKTKNQQYVQLNDNKTP